VSPENGLEFLIDLPVQSYWENIERVRTSVLNCLSAVFSAPPVEDWYSFATVASELMENAIKYGHWPAPGGHLHVRLWGDGQRAHVQVSNPVAEGDSGVHELMQTLAWLDQFEDPSQAYMTRMMEIAAEPVGVTKLGLARIAYESRCKLAAEVDGGMLRVTGVTSFG
jgi:hypothetical protein